MSPSEAGVSAGVIAHWDLGFLDPGKPLESQIDNLKEDLAQITYGEVVVDVSWRPSFSLEGSFVIVAVKNSDWDFPLFQERPRSIAEMLTAMRNAIVLAEGLVRSGSHNA